MIIYVYCTHMLRMCTVHKHAILDIIANGVCDFTKITEFRIMTL